MPVGAGSIRRVAKAAGTEKAKEAAPVVKEAAEKKTATKTTTAKTTSKPTASTKKVAATASGTKATSTVEYNKVYHITEELPIYLL